MAWPKGMPRKGHVNKDGSQHAKRGAKKHQREFADIVKAADTAVSVVRERPSPERPLAIKVTRLSPEPENDNPNHPLAIKGAVGTGAITEPCPNCGYAYADGGYCPDCGWSKPINRLPYGTATGPKRK